MECLGLLGGAKCFNQPKAALGYIWGSKLLLLLIHIMSFSGFNDLISDFFKYLS